MSFCGKLLLAIAASAAAAGSGLSQATEPQTEEGDETILCVGGPTWRPLAEDVARIEAMPVPAQFREIYESREPCSRMAPNDRRLVDWHLSFGSERSAMRALAYLERDHMRTAPATARYARELERAWRAALPDLRRAQAVQQPEGVNYSARHRFMASRRSIRRLEDLVRTRRAYLFLAEQYLRVAEEFGSADLLEKAEHYLAPLLEAAAFLEPLERQPAMGDLFSFDLDSFQTDDFRMRAAVLRARLTRAPDDLANAQALVQSLERPVFRRAIVVAYSGGSDFCDISDEWGRTDEAIAACREDHVFHERVTDYWISRTSLDLVAGAENLESYDAVVRILEEEMVSRNGGRCCHRSAKEDLLRLYLSRADYHRRRFTEAVNARDDNAMNDHWRGALDALSDSETLVAPFEAPARFRRIAQDWLAIWSQAYLLEPNVDDRRPTDSPYFQRYATYLRRLLGSLDAIATGADPGLPSRN